MLKAERVAHIQETLERLYPETPVPLDHRDPYELISLNKSLYLIEKHLTYCY